MKLYSIALKNIRKRFARFVLLVLILTIAVATVVGLVLISKVMDIDLQNKIDEYGANMVIVPKTKSLPLTYAGVTIGAIQSETAFLKESDLKKVRSIPNKANLNVVAPKLIDIASVENKKLLIAGINFKDEFKLKPWLELKSGNYPNKNDELLIGGKVALQNNFQVGQKIRINKHEFSIAGILSMVGAQEDELIYVGLAQAQELLKRPGQLTMIEVSAWCRNCPIDEMVAQISDILPTTKVSAVRQVAETREAIVKQFKTFSIIILLAMIVVAALVVFANILSSVRLRKNEIGILRAIGFRKRHVLLIVILEAVFASFLAGVLGFLLGLVGAKVIAPYAIGIDVDVTLQPTLAAIAILATLFLSVIASLYPAISASKTDPVEAIRAL